MQDRKDAGQVRSRTVEKKRLEAPGIDHSTYRMLSEHSTSYAPDI